MTMKLNQRELLFIFAGVIILAILGVNFLIIEPISRRTAQMRELTVRLEEDLAEMRVLAAEYQAMAARQRQIKTKIAAREQDFAPFSYLETLARQADLGDNIESMTPVASMGEEKNIEEIELRLSGIGLQSLVRFLYTVETSDKILFVNDLRVRPRYLEPEILDVTVRIATPISS